jgi:hypothetical protein
VLLEHVADVRQEPHPLRLVGIYRLSGNPTGPLRPVATGGIGNRQQRAPVVGSAIVEVRRNVRIGTAQPTDIVTRPSGTHSGELVEFFGAVVPEVLDPFIGALALQHD